MILIILGRWEQYHHHNSISCWTSTREGSINEYRSLLYSKKPSSNMIFISLYTLACSSDFIKEEWRSWIICLTFTGCILDVFKVALILEQMFQKLLTMITWQIIRLVKLTLQLFSPNWQITTWLPIPMYVQPLGGGSGGAGGRPASQPTHYNATLNLHYDRLPSISIFLCPVTG